VNVTPLTEHLILTFLIIATLMIFKIGFNLSGVNVPLVTGDTLTPSSVQQKTDVPFFDQVFNF
jgi:hypothetical protein